MSVAWVRLQRLLRRYRRLEHLAVRQARSTRHRSFSKLKRHHHLNQSIKGPRKATHGAGGATSQHGHSGQQTLTHHHLLRAVFSLGFVFNVRWREWREIARLGSALRRIRDRVVRTAWRIWRETCADARERARRVDMAHGRVVSTAWRVWRETCADARETARRVAMAYRSVVSTAWRVWRETCADARETALRVAMAYPTHALRTYKDVLRRWKLNYTRILRIARAVGRAVGWRQWRRSVDAAVARVGATVLCECREVTLGAWLVPRRQASALACWRDTAALDATFKAALARAVLWGRFDSQQPRMRNGTFQEGSVTSRNLLPEQPKMRDGTFQEGSVTSREQPRMRNGTFQEGSVTSRNLPGRFRARMRDLRRSLAAWSSETLISQRAEAAGRAKLFRDACRAWAQQVPHLYAYIYINTYIHTYIFIHLCMGIYIYIP